MKRIACALAIAIGCSTPPDPPATSETDHAIVQALWTQLFPPSVPAVRRAHAMAYDSTRGRIVLFGGENLNGGQLNDTWEWNGTNWVFINITDALKKPSARKRHAMAFHPPSGRVVLYGGDIGGVRSNETWSFNGTAWTRHTGGPLPPLLAGHAMAYNPLTQRVVMFGGIDGADESTGVLYDDIWTWNGGQWTNDAAASGLTRVAGAMFFDESLGKMIHFGGFQGGTPQSATHRLDGNTWTFVTGTGPPARCCGAIAYDSARDRAILFGGRNASTALGDTWEWNSTAWVQVAASGSPAPSARKYAALAYDVVKREAIMFGGQLADNTRLNQTWSAKPIGQTCALPSDCPTNFCVDGVCCESSACSVCETCASPANTGRCDPIVSAPDPDTCSGSSSCDATGVCRLNNGEACAAGPDCLSGFCVDGVCCDSVCDAPCQACTAAAKMAGPDGTCGNAKANTDPHDDCVADPQISCDRSGVCNGAGACAPFYPDGTQCGASVCTAEDIASGSSCNGAGTCVNQLSTCTPYKCKPPPGGSGACATICQSDDDCVSTHYCAGGPCLPKVGNGLACSTAHECLSGFCTRGVCCDQPCVGLCEECADGSCGPSPAGTDPYEHCEDDGPLSCDRDGSCDGNRRCAIYGNTTSCGSTCIGGDEAARLCNGTGACLVNTTTDCGLHKCIGTGCKDPCEFGFDCVAGAYCDGGTCNEQLPRGAACTDDQQCLSNACEDGYCCDRSCSDICEACDAAGAVGTCVPVFGAPRPDRPPCPEAIPGEPCTAKICDGTTTSQCDGNVFDLECRPGACADATHALVRATCNGAGACPAPLMRNCHPYTCADEACLERCDGPGDCVAGYRCELASGRCMPGSSCDGAHTVTGADTRVTDCAPYRCAIADGACLTSCEDTTDCVVGLVCAGATCVQPLTAPARGTGGCASSSPDAGTGVLIAIGLLALCRRRRAVRATALAALVCIASACDAPPPATSERSQEIVQRLWTDLGITGPPARSGHAAAYDSARDVVVVFGGINAGGGFLDDTWELSGTTWTQMFPAVRPLPRTGHRMAYDAVRGKVVMFGGKRPNNQRFNDTWLWNGSSWTQVSMANPSVSPPARDHHIMVFDSKRSVAVMCCGETAAGNVNDTWEWNGTKWQDRLTDLQVPLARHNAASAYDRARERTVVVGGLISAVSNETWEWDGANWVEKFPPGLPSARQGAAMAYDPQRAVSIMFGGRTGTATFAETFEYNGAYASIGGTQPAARSDATFVFDTVTKRGVLFGGLGAGGVRLGDTHVYRAVGQPCIQGAECPTGNCVDGVCCSTASCATCETCASATDTGNCSPITSAPDPDSCAGNEQCNAAGQCKLLLGQTCTAASDCLSGFCADGVCCDTACDSTCLACRADRKASGTSGTCGNTRNGLPDAGCPVDPVGSCDRDGMCDGAGACRRYAPSTACGPTSCIGAEEGVQGSLCDGIGNCQLTGGNCAPYRCRNGACTNPCVVDGDCKDGFRCIGGECVDKLPVGEPCDANIDCLSGFCRNEVCCASDCSSPCEVCRADLKASGDQSGVCGTAVADTDPDDDCVDQGPASCGRTSECDGIGGCRAYPNGTECQPAECDTENQAVTYACGAGACVELRDDCGLYRCSAAACPTTCASDGDCTDSGRCVGNQCIAKDERGAPCTSSNSCASGFCADGYCCDSPCQGQCEGCSLAGSEGTCAPVMGDPIAPRPACELGIADPCATRRCDGIAARGFCAAFVTGDECRAAGCELNVAITSASCDGSGVCPAAAEMSCGFYNCRAGACLTSCTTHDDCAVGARCDNTICVSGKTCDGYHIVTGADLRTQDCTPYRCQASGDCIDRCASSTDCVAGYVCDDDASCVDPAFAKGASVGCGCRTGDPSGTAWLALALLLLLRRRVELVHVRRDP